MTNMWRIWFIMYIFYNVIKWLFSIKYLSTYMIVTQFCGCQRPFLWRGVLGREHEEQRHWAAGKAEEKVNSHTCQEFLINQCKGDPFVQELTFSLTWLFGDPAPQEKTQQCVCFLVFNISWKNWSVVSSSVVNLTLNTRSVSEEEEFL